MSSAMDMTKDPDTLKRLRQLLDEQSDWGKRIERFAADYGKLTESEAGSLSEEMLKRLWWAQGFAQTGTPGYPAPNPKQWQALRRMTTLLASRNKSLGERFSSAQAESDKSFSKTQLPVLLRTLLILEAGSFGTIATKNATNIVLKAVGKAEMNYLDPASITTALDNLRSMIEEWAPAAQAKSLGERARIPWHLRQIVAPESTTGEKPIGSSNEEGVWKFTTWMGPLLAALRSLGGSGTPGAVREKILQSLEVPDSVLTEKMPGSDQTRFYNGLAWARKYLIWEGLLKSPERGIWSLTEEGEKATIDEQRAQQIAKKWAARHRQSAQVEAEGDVANSVKDTNVDMTDSGEDPQKSSIEPYDKAKAMSGLFLAPVQFDEMLAALQEKKNVVLRGPPGVGKTYVARRLAYAFIGSNDPRRLEMVQFHQSYSYEDFIEGFRPAPAGHFELKHGIFHDFCARAQKDEGLGKPYVFIIDEINRGNLSKIFGELMILIEPDKRGKEYAVRLPYSADTAGRFYVPENIHLIGMMNTADRSLAMVDYALRRRFRFITLQPEFSSKAFRAFLEKAGATADLAQKIIDRMSDLNTAIVDDTKNLGSGYEIGHSYFCPPSGTKADEGWYRRVVQSEVLPLIQEYWFDDELKVKNRLSALLA